MKKMTALLLALLLCSTLILPAAAEQKADHELTYEYTAPEPTFSLVVPQKTKLTGTEFESIGMVGITNTVNCWNYQVKVDATIDDNFVGAETNFKVNTQFGMRYTEAVDGSDFAGEGFTFIFPNVQEDGSILSEAHHLSSGGPLVKELLVWGYFNGVNAPSDTYTTQVHFTAELELSNDGSATE